jgi:hypothetical protein
MALPGTELFRTLYEKGAITIDRDYFRHILNGLSLYPAMSLSEHMGRPELFYWKLRFVAAFYGARMRVLGLQAVLASVRQTLSGRTHSSKLQTALRVSVKNAFRSIGVRFRPVGWRGKPRPASSSPGTASGGRSRCSDARRGSSRRLRWTRTRFRIRT